MVESPSRSQIGFDFEHADFLVPVIVGGRVGAANGNESKQLLKRVFTAAGFPSPKFTFHGFRAFLNTAASQLMVEKSAREFLGGWGRNSNMVTTYDRTTGAAELHLRSSIMQFCRDGGRLGNNFELPKFGPAPAAPLPRPKAAARPRKKAGMQAPKRRSRSDSSSSSSDSDASDSSSDSSSS